MIDIDPSEFENMLFNVHPVGPETDILKKFPRLGMIPEFHYNTQGGKITRNSIIKYVIYVYDKGSPLRVRITDIDKRKMFALDLSGIWKPKNSTSKPSKWVEQLLNNKIVQINQMIVEYVRLFHEHKYAFMIGLEQLYYSQMKSIFTNSDNVKIKELQDTQQLLEKTITELLGDERDMRIKKDLHEIMVFKKLELRPEEIAKLLAQSRRFSAEDYA